MKKVICDTCIWYDMGAGRIPTPDDNTIQLFATQVNILELYRTPNIIDDTKMVQDSIRALRQNYKSIFEINPMEWIILKQYPEYEITDHQHAEILKAFSIFLSMDAEAPIDKEHKDKYRKIVSAYKEELQKLTDDINSFLPELRLNIKNSTGKKAHREKYSIPAIMDFVAMLVKQYTGGKIELNIETYPWHEIGFFIIVCDEFFKEVELCGSGKMQPNDWLDLFGMVYVHDDFYYTTSENKWIRLIQLNEETEKQYIKL